MNKLFRVQREEYGLVAVLGLILFSNAVAQQIAGIVSVSGFLSSGSVNGVLVVWVVDMLLIALVTWLQTLVVDRLNRVKLMRWLLLGCGLSYGVLRLMFAAQAPHRAIYAAMFVFADLQWVIFPLVFWIMANDLSDMAQAKRLFPLIGAASFVGKLVGIGITLSLPSLFRAWAIKPVEALALNVVIYLLACAVLLIGLPGAGERPLAPKHESLRETLTAGWEFVYGVPSFRYLMLAILAAGVCLTILEFHFLGVTKAAYGDQASYQQFYSAYRLAITLASMLIQGFLTSRILGRIALKNAFLIMPASLLVGAVWMIGAPGLVSAVGGMFAPKLVQKTLDETALSTFQALVPEERRGRVSAFLESYPIVAGTLIGVALLAASLALGGALGNRGYTIGYLFLAVLSAVIALALAVKARAVYDASLLNWRIKRRQRMSSLASKLNF
jgi:ATP:ADP antiporter, AAA family